MVARSSRSSHFVQKVLEDGVRSACTTLGPFHRARPGVALQHPMSRALANHPTRVISGQFHDDGLAVAMENVQGDGLRAQLSGRMEGKANPILADLFGAPIHPPGTAARAEVTGFNEPPDPEGAVAHDDDRNLELVAGQEFLR